MENKEGGPVNHSGLSPAGVAAAAPEPHNLHERGHTTHGRKPIVRIIIVRHGLSEANVNLSSRERSKPDWKDIYEEKCDQALELYGGGTKVEENGVMQAQAAGEFLRRFYEQRIQEGEKPKIMAYTSCYKRARQTLAEIDKKMNGLIERTQDHILLGEQDFGSFEGTGAEKWKLHYLTEVKRFDVFTRCKQWFWARNPGGESRFDVCRRVKEFFASVYRAAERGYTDFIIVCHGVTVRAIRMMWMRQTPEWMEETENPGNASIWLIENHLQQEKRDQGCIFPGWKLRDHGGGGGGKADKSAAAGAAANNDDLERFDLLQAMLSGNKLSVLGEEGGKTDGEEPSSSSSSSSAAGGDFEKRKSAFADSSKLLLHMSGSGGKRALSHARANSSAKHAAQSAQKNAAGGNSNSSYLESATLSSFSSSSDGGWSAKAKLAAASGVCIGLGVAAGVLTNFIATSSSSPTSSSATSGKK